MDAAALKDPLGDMVAGLAVGEKLAALLTEAYLEERGKRSSRKRCDRALSKVADIEPDDVDRLVLRRTERLGTVADDDPPGRQERTITSREAGSLRPIYRDGLQTANEYDVGMRLISARVSDGKITVPPGLLEEGESVAILAMGETEPVALSEEDRRELADRGQAIARGEFVDGDEFIKELKARRPA